MTQGLDALPEAWRSDRALLGGRGRWDVRAVHVDADRAVVLEVVSAGRRSVLGHGDPVVARELVRRVSGPVDFLTLPRLRGGPAGVHGAPLDDPDLLHPDQDLTAELRTRLGVAPATAWDWMATQRVPPAPEVGAERLDPQADAEAVRDCLAEANPGTSADPAAPGEVAWFGVRSAGGRLIGVIGASARTGDPARSDASWHLHGLGVRPEARGRGLGAALTAVVTRSALESGADWVSLGMYASNAPARRIYQRLGFDVEGRFTSYRPASS